MSPEELRQIEDRPFDIREFYYVRLPPASLLILMIHPTDISEPCIYFQRPCS